MHFHRIFDGCFVVFSVLVGTHLICCSVQSRLLEFQSNTFFFLRKAFGRHLRYKRFTMEQNDPRIGHIVYNSVRRNDFLHDFRLIDITVYANRGYNLKILTKIDFRSYN